MKVALVDNGSLEPETHLRLRAIAAQIAARTGIEVDAVSWKHSDRIKPEALEDRPAHTLVPWLRAQVCAGEREFIFVPFFISSQGAIGSWLRRDIEKLQLELGGFRFLVASGLADEGALTRIVAANIRETLRADALQQPPVILVDHGGPSAASAALRDQIAGELRNALGDEIGPLLAASMEGADHEHCHPLFSEALRTPGFDRGNLIIAPLFLAPGRHAGPQGDLAEFAAAAEADRARLPLRCHFAALVGTHPEVVSVLSTTLTRILSSFHLAA